MIQLIINRLSAHLRRCSIGTLTVALLVATALSAASGYSEEEEQIVKQARTDLVDRLYLYHADGVRKRLSKSHLTHQEIESIISSAITRRANCEVDAMLTLVGKRPELELIKLLSWLAGKRYEDMSPVALNSATKQLFEDEKENCDAEYYRAVVR